jgi:hypothetical protein
MDDALQLPVSYKNETLEFPFRVAHLGFVRRFIVDVNGVEVHYETDDSGELRAIIPHINELTVATPKKDLLEAIGTSISALMN